MKISQLNTEKTKHKDILYSKRFSIKDIFFTIRKEEFNYIEDEELKTIDLYMFLKIIKLYLKTWVNDLLWKKENIYFFLGGEAVMREIDKKIYKKNKENPISIRWVNRPIEFFQIFTHIRKLPKLNEPIKSFFDYNQETKFKKEQ